MERDSSIITPRDQEIRSRHIAKRLASFLVSIAVTGVISFAAYRTIAQHYDSTHPNKASDFAATPLWEQDFSTMPDGAPDPTVWRYDLDPNVPGWNNERQGYTDRLANVRIEGGRLILQAIREDYTYANDPQQRQFNFTSGRIDTKDRFSFRYGKLEARMKLPGGGDGAWPAFWLLSASRAYTKALNPTDEEIATEGFYLHDGEIDIMENVTSEGCKVHATVHTFATKDRPQSGSAHVPDCATEFHTYALEWRPDSLVFSVDGKPYHTVTKTSDDPDAWPFDQPMYIILNLAMGGSMGGDIDPHQKQWQVEVERVTVFAYTKLTPTN